MGQQRYYNKAQMLVIVTNNAVNISIRTPSSTNLTAITFAACTNFISTNKTFFDLRENKTIKTTEVDIYNFTKWVATNSTVTNLYGSTPPDIVYIADNRTNTSSTLDAVRLVNGATNLTGGLTLATPNPLYVKGNYNCPNSADLGTTNTTHTQPCSLVSDAFTLLSANWNDASNYSNGALSSRVPVSTTVNAAIMTGNVPWTNGQSSYYSGGANNLPRLLEDWTSSMATTFNTSFICMFNSTKATGQFQQSGSYYNIPSRNFYFDNNFTDSSKLPPGSPQVRAIIKYKWTVPTPNSTNYAGY